MPSSPAERPLRNDPSDSDEIRISAITMTAKFSNGPNATAMLGERRRQQHQRSPRQRAADQRGGVAEPERPAGLAAPRELVAVKAGHDRVGLARDAHQRRRDEPAGHAAHEHGDEQRHRVDARHVVGEGQRQRHEHAGRDAGQDADRDAERNARQHDGEGA